MAGKSKRKNKRKRSTAEHYIEYLGVRLAAGVLHTLGVRRSLRLAMKIGEIMWDHYPKGRKKAVENLRSSFPEKDEEWIKQTCIKSFQHLVMLAVDVFFTTKLVRRDNWRDYAEFINAERAKWLMAEKKGLIMLTGHYGNFEIMGYLMGLFGFDVYSIARPIDNPFVNKWLYSVRERHGQHIINKKGAAKVMPELVKKGATLGFIADQNAGRKGIFVDFFGKPASTYKSIGLLAITENLPVVVGVCRQRMGEFFFEIECGRIITPAEWQDKENPLKWLTQEYSGELEKLIRKAPEQYWWIHRRWKTRPEDVKRKRKAKAGKN
ncbi:Lipid A biosynthesis lauroyl acyltransferase [Sedimentisphaera cyanobacteriorum]|uniref:Lipid A biosynthesis lauroyl acyltransferase n=1 Tax=Sedimentisphaera cyanobacteriorum TaxID=1940790 RepID=A0A1Q2HPC8_9BACT|nr:lysophospholipid acyltransferase family protein [Sedimentisphaera cyanobacteriorum]AQQ09288.1 Lipid A biosynthesis lauroyl acyltransferase [Sedimentisphaera cyanobacteriorum]